MQEMYIHIYEHNKAPILRRKRASALAYAYDEMGFRVEMNDAVGEVTYEYDALGNATKIVHHNGDTVVYEYDTMGRLSKLTYPDGDSTAYEYDLCDRLVKVIGRDGGITTYEYDANGSVTRCDRSNGTYTTYEYNARGELTLMENRRADKCSTLLSSYAYEYDRNGYITVETEKVDSYTYVRTYTYDAVGQLVGYTETTNGKKTATYNYTYDNAGNRVGMEYYDSCRTKYRIDYVYDANNELVSETKYNTSGKREFINAHITYTYDADGNLIEKRSGRYDVWQYFYTAESRLDAVTRGGTLLMAATYDGDNNRVFRMSLETDAASSALKVEGNIRCKWYRENGGCVSSFHFDRYDYKHHGDIYYYYDGCDYVWWGKGGRHDLAMHHNGRFDDCFIDHDHCDHDRDCRHDRECKHDYENQKFVWGLAGEAAEVNGRDYLPYNKLYKYTDYELIYYINDVTIDNEEVLVEYGANGTATGTYEYGNERLSVEYANHAKEYYLYNGTGNVTQTTAQNGSLYLRYTYDAFGNITSIRAPFAVDTDNINRYTYNGEDYDYSTGLQYLRARYYSPSTGSFISQDTYLGQIISPLSQNRYTYCHNNPVMYDDPSGYSIDNIYDTAEKERESYNDNNLLMESDVYIQYIAILANMHSYTTECDAEMLLSTEMIFNILAPNNTGAQNPVNISLKKAFLSLLFSWVKNNEELVWNFLNSTSVFYPYPSNYSNNAIVLSNSNAYTYGLYIRNQGDPFWDSVNIGNSTMGDSGCGAIATYNALLGLNDNTQIEDIIDWYETQNALNMSGVYGVNPYKIDDYFNAQGYSTVMYTDVLLLPNVPTSDVVVICHWNDKSDITNGAHFVALTSYIDSNGFKYYVAHNDNGLKTRYNSLSDYYVANSIYEFIAAIEVY